MKILWKDKFKEKDKIVYWIREWFESEVQVGENNDYVMASKILPEINVDDVSKKALVNITGGKDSAIVAALCVEALGKNRVVGVIAYEPTSNHDALRRARKVVDILGIEHYSFDISSIVNTYRAAFTTSIARSHTILYPEAYRKLPKHIINSILYTIAAQDMSANVACCQNASELYIGYNTKFGDLAGDFAPLADIPSTLVTDIGRAIAYTVPELSDIIENDPVIGVDKVTGENTFGFGYEELDNYLFNIEGIISETGIEKIKLMHKLAKSKARLAIPKYKAVIKDSVDEENQIIYAETT